MAEQDGILYSPARVNPYANVQVADFSNIQYLRPSFSDTEPNEIEYGEEEGNGGEGTYEYLAPEEAPIIPEVAWEKKKKKEKRRSKRALPEPESPQQESKREPDPELVSEPESDADRAEPATKKKAKNARKKEIKRESKKSRDSEKSEKSPKKSKDKKSKSRSSEVLEPSLVEEPPGATMDGKSDVPPADEGAPDTAGTTKTEEVAAVRESDVTTEPDNATKEVTGEGTAVEAAEVTDPLTEGLRKEESETTMPEVASESMPGPAPDAASEVAPRSTQSATSEVSSEPVPEPSTEAATEVASEKPPEIIPEATSEAAPHVLTEPTPEVITETASETVKELAQEPEMEPGRAAEVAQEAAPDLTPEVESEAALDVAAKDLTNSVQKQENLVEADNDQPNKSDEAGPAPEPAVVSECASRSANKDGSAADENDIPKGSDSMLDMVGAEAEAAPIIPMEPAATESEADQATDDTSEVPQCISNVATEAADIDHSGGPEHVPEKVPEPTAKPEFEPEAVADAVSEAESEDGPSKMTKEDEKIVGNVEDMSSVNHNSPEPQTVDEVSTAATDDVQPKAIEQLADTLENPQSPNTEQPQADSQDQHRKAPQDEDQTKIQQQSTEYIAMETAAAVESEKGTAEDETTAEAALSVEASHEEVPAEELMDGETTVEDVSQSVENIPVEKEPANIEPEVALDSQAVDNDASLSDASRDEVDENCDDEMDDKAKELSEAATGAVAESSAVPNPNQSPSLDSDNTEAEEKEPDDEALEVATTTGEPETAPAPETSEDESAVDSALAEENTKPEGDAEISRQDEDKQTEAVTSADQINEAKQPAVEHKITEEAEDIPHGQADLDTAENVEPSAENKVHQNVSVEAASTDGDDQPAEAISAEGRGESAQADQVSPSDTIAQPDGIDVTKEGNSTKHESALDSDPVNTTEEPTKDSERQKSRPNPERTTEALSRDLAEVVEAADTAADEANAKHNPVEAEVAPSTAQEDAPISVVDTGILVEENFSKPESDLEVDDHLNLEKMAERETEAPTPQTNEGDADVKDAIESAKSVPGADVSTEEPSEGEKTIEDSQPVATKSNQETETVATADAEPENVTGEAEDSTTGTQPEDGSTIDGPAPVADAVAAEQSIHDAEETRATDDAGAVEEADILKSVPGDESPQREEITTPEAAKASSEPPATTAALDAATEAHDSATEEKAIVETAAGETAAASVSFEEAVLADTIPNLETKNEEAPTVNAEETHLPQIDAIAHEEHAATEEPTIIEEPATHEEPVTPELHVSEVEVAIHNEPTISDVTTPENSTAHEETGVSQEEEVAHKEAATPKESTTSEEPVVAEESAIPGETHVSQGEVATHEEPADLEEVAGSEATASEQPVAPEESAVRDKTHTSQVEVVTHEAAAIPKEPVAPEELAPGEPPLEESHASQKEAIAHKEPSAPEAAISIKQDAPGGSIAEDKPSIDELITDPQADEPSTTVDVSQEEILPESTTIESTEAILPSTATEVKPMPEVVAESAPAEAPTIRESLGDEDVIEGAIAEEPAIEEPAIEEPTIEEPTIDEVTVKGAAEPEAIVEDTAAEEAVKETQSEKTSATEPDPEVTPKTDPVVELATDSVVEPNTEPSAAEPTSGESTVAAETEAKEPLTEEDPTEVAPIGVIDDNINQFEDTSAAPPSPESPPVSSPVLEAAVSETAPTIQPTPTADKSSIEVAPVIETTLTTEEPPTLEAPVIEEPLATDEVASTENAPVSVETPFVEEAPLVNADPIVEESAAVVDSAPAEEPGVTEAPTSSEEIDDAVDTFATKPPTAEAAAVGMENVVHAREQVPVAEEPTAIEEPAAVEESIGTEEPVLADMSRAVKEHMSSEEPTVIEEPTIAKEPIHTEGPMIVEIPAVTEEPAVVDEPIIAKEAPVDKETTIIEEPTIAREPTVTEKYMAVEESTAAEELTAVVESAVTEEPAIVHEPIVIDKSTVSKELDDSEEPVVVEERAVDKKHATVQEPIVVEEPTVAEEVPIEETQVVQAVPVVEDSISIESPIVERAPGPRELATAGDRPTTSEVSVSKQIPIAEEAPVVDQVCAETTPVEHDAPTAKTPSARELGTVEKEVPVIEAAAVAIETKETVSRNIPPVPAKPAALRVQRGAAERPRDKIRNDKAREVEESMDTLGPIQGDVDSKKRSRGKQKPLSPSLETTPGVEAGNCGGDESEPAHESISSGDRLLEMLGGVGEVIATKYSNPEEVSQDGAATAERISGDSWEAIDESVASELAWETVDKKDISRKIKDSRKTTEQGHTRSLISEAAHQSDEIPSYPHGNLDREVPHKYLDSLSSKSSEPHSTNTDEFEARSPELEQHELPRPESTEVSLRHFSLYRFIPIELDSIQGPSDDETEWTPQSPRRRPFKGPVEWGTPEVTTSHISEITSVFDAALQEPVSEGISVAEPAISIVQDDESEAGTPTESPGQIDISGTSNSESGGNEVGTRGTANSFEHPVLLPDSLGDIHPHKAEGVAFRGNEEEAIPDETQWQGSQDPGQGFDVAGNGIDASRSDISYDFDWSSSRLSLTGQPDQTSFEPLLSNEFLDTIDVAFAPAKALATTQKQGQVPQGTATLDFEPAPAGSSKALDTKDYYGLSGSQDNNGSTSQCSKPDVSDSQTRKETTVEPGIYINSPSKSSSESGTAPHPRAIEQHQPTLPRQNQHIILDPIGDGPVDQHANGLDGGHGSLDSFAFVHKPVSAGQIEGLPSSGGRLMLLKSRGRKLRPAATHLTARTNEPAYNSSLSSDHSDTEELRSSTPAIVLPDFNDPGAMALGRSRSINQRRRQHFRDVEETLATAVVLYATAVELSPPPDPHVDAGGGQAGRGAADITKGPVQVFSDLTLPGRSAAHSVDGTDSSAAYTDLSTDDDGKDRYHRHRAHRSRQHSSQSKDSTSGDDYRRRRHRRHRSGEDDEPLLKTSPDRALSSRHKRSEHRRQDTGYDSSHNRYESGHESSHNKYESGHESSHRRYESGHESSRRRYEEGYESSRRRYEDGYESSHRRFRTPEEQAAHEQRKEERRIRREQREKERGRDREKERLREREREREDRRREADVTPPPPPPPSAPVPLENGHSPRGLRRDGTERRVVIKEEPIPVPTKRGFLGFRSGHSALTGARVPSKPETAALPKRSSPQPTSILKQPSRSYREPSGSPKAHREPNESLRSQYELNGGPPPPHRGDLGGDNNNTIPRSHYADLNDAPRPRSSRRHDEAQDDPAPRRPHRERTSRPRLNSDPKASSRSITADGYGGRAPTTRPRAESDARATTSMPPKSESDAKQQPPTPAQKLRPTEPAPEDQRHGPRREERLRARDAERKKREASGGFRGVFKKLFT